jgi:hypothetical protein
MNSNRYAAAGWAAILSAAGTLAMLGLSFAFEFTKLVQQGGPRGLTTTIWNAQQVTLVAAVDLVAWVLGIYALVRFRDLVRERYDFHALDHLIWVVIGAGLLTAIVSHGIRAASSRGLATAATGIASMAVLGILNGIIGIVFATRLLRMNGNLNGYKKPLAYVYLAGSVCFLLVIPSLVGIVLLTAWSVLLGLAFFRGEELEELEVV